MKSLTIALVIAATFAAGCVVVPDPPRRDEVRRDRDRDHDRDRDRDGVPNRVDRDRDGDGVRNRDDRRPDDRRRN